ncbi:protein tyrosine phosphatase family protein [Calothrix sp. NIES-3974]|uniref:protein tyrosine phosphatase family protein n=1 Tax=Calothrix sp. NIES-3974 TaxID=2005462 RepID=UPI000B600AE3|nr:protein tyrosine phosphatase family protein [Calothrix sp. NIES-3974]BAZ05494.1 hypothetical protein NIES3974_21420 [Calothrix sp. NIES-3974]
MDEILNYYLVNDTLATSGQPTAAQLELIAANGYEVVINLAMPNSENAIANEGYLVTSQAMIYFHLPVVWNNPQFADLVLFCQIMQALKGKRVWVHCAKNMRVSCFVYLYQKHVLKSPEPSARYPMDLIWSPEGEWKDLIAQAEQECDRLLFKA